MASLQTRTPDVTTAAEPRRWWEGLERQQVLAYTAGCLAWLFDSVDQQLFNLAREGAMEHLSATSADASRNAGYATSLFLIGWAGGGLLFGPLGDRHGRAKVLSLTVLLYSVCTGLGAFATSVPLFFLFRVLTGLGVGGVFGLAVALVSDALPARSRASGLAWLQGLSLLGNIGAALLAIAVGYAAERALLPWYLAPWQVLFLAGALPAALSFLLLSRVEEPAAWVAAQQSAKARGLETGSYRALLTHPRWARHAWLGLVLCSAGIVGLWGIGNFHPKIVRSLVESTVGDGGGARARWTGIALLLQNAGGFMGMMFLANLAKRHGRKIALATGFLLSFATTVLVFTSLRHLNQVWWMLPLMGFGQLSVFAVFAIQLPELFPPSVRSTGCGFCYNAGRLVAASAPFTLGRLTASLGGDIESFRKAGLVLSLVLLIGLAVLPFLPETKDAPLPEEF